MKKIQDSAWPAQLHRPAQEEAGYELAGLDDGTGCSFEVARSPRQLAQRRVIDALLGSSSTGQVIQRMRKQNGKGKDRVRDADSDEEAEDEADEELEQESQAEGVSEDPESVLAGSDSSARLAALRAERHAEDIKWFKMLVQPDDRERRRVNREQWGNNTIRADIHQPELLTEAPRTRGGVNNLSDQDYESGYISDEGGSLIERVKARILPLERRGTLKRTSIEKGKEKHTGELQDDKYYGAPISYRIDYTRSMPEEESKVEQEPISKEKPPPKQTAGAKRSAKRPRLKKGSDAPQPPGTWEPHVRVIVAGKDLRTKEAAKLVKAMRRLSDDKRRAFFDSLSGVRQMGDSELTPEARYGTELRTLVRLSNAGDRVTTPSLDGRMLSTATSPDAARLLFQNDDYVTGGLGTQNFDSRTKLAEFDAYRRLARSASSGVATVGTMGTDPREKAEYRKWKAMAAVLPSFLTVSINPETGKPAAPELTARDQLSTASISTSDVSTSAGPSGSTGPVSTDHRLASQDLIPASDAANPSTSHDPAQAHQPLRGRGRGNRRGEK